ncbi:MAG: 6-hydroxymethylpterin diphosphokinase MptE-like protein, partial [Candidatus Thorarchaeota archaeon]
MSHFNIQKFDFYPQFKNWYFKILKKFKFDYKKDVEAAQVITHILSEKEPSWDLSKILNSFQDHIKSREIIMIYGCGPSLEETVSKLKTILSDSFFNQVINLAADGASVLLREMGIPIDGIFTDLDGISEKELTIAKFIVVHAHGDNIDKILKYKESILKLKNLLVTVQVEPTDFTLNAGGFT